MKKILSLSLALLLTLSAAACASLSELSTLTELTEALEATKTEQTETETSNPPKKTEASTEAPTPVIPNNPGVDVLPSFTSDDAKELMGANALAYTVGEDKYDLDCKAYLLKSSSMDAYRSLVSRLESKGLAKYCENGSNGINGECFQTTLYNSEYTVNITFYSRMGELYMTVEKYRALSPFAIAPSAVEQGTDTVFHMPEMPTVNGSYKFGECEIFELSNGHFVIVDGAQEFSAEPTVEYLENLTENGEVPIVDAWFLTHAHPDHSYCIWGIGRDENLVKRIRVEGFYYTWPNDEGMRRESDYSGLLEQVANVNGALENFRTSNGEVSPRYKLHGGMRFYFNELEVQVLFTQDQMMPSEYGNGFNDSSTSFKFVVHTKDKADTTFLIMGDASDALCKKLMAKYEATTLHTTFFQSLHHGNNDSLTFFKYINPDYLNYTHKSDEKGKNKSGYKYLASTCKAVYCSPQIIKISELD